VAPAEGVSPAALVASINARSDDLDALTRRQAADEAPGVAQVRQSFQVIFLLYALVVPFVTGLFFLIITVQKAAALTLLRAIGAPGRRLVGALLVQVVIIVGLALALGVALYTPLTIVSATSLGLRFETTAVIAWAILLFVLALLSSLLSARRVLAIDPVTATVGAGLR
jgi:putative ABC transport system permease protein